MKQKIIKILKIIVPLGIGVYLTWFFYSGLSEEEKQGIPKAFASANYFWVILSLAIAWLSHFSRAYRWKYMLESLGYKAKFKSMYHSVMIGYIINLTIPRSGEFARAGFFSKKENLPFDKVFGTIVAERIIDLIMLLSIIFITTFYVGSEVIDDITKPKFDKEITITKEFASQSFGIINTEEITNGFFVQYSISEEIPNESIITLVNKKPITNINVALENLIGQKVKLEGIPPKKDNTTLYFILGGLFMIGVLIFVFVKKIQNFIVSKLIGLWEGVKSVFYLKKRVPFILLTLFIWFCYILMFWICALGVNGVEKIGLDAVLVCFVVGGIAIAATPGGIGLYPLFVTAALVYFEVNKAEASGFSILLWVIQTMFLVVFGLISLYAINVKFDASEIEKK